MLVYSLLTAVVVILEKSAFDYASPATVLIYLYIIQLITLLPHMITRYEKPKEFPKFLKLMSWIVLVNVAAQMLQLYSVEQIFASYAFAVQRLDIIITIVMGWVLLREPKLLRQLLAGLIALLGVVIVANS